MLADEVFAQSATSPWMQAVQALQTAFTGPIATGLALVAIVVGGLMFAPRGRSQTHRVGVNFGVGMASKDTGRKLAHFDRELNAGRTPIPPHLHREELN